VLVLVLQQRAVA